MPTSDEIKQTIRQFLAENLQGADGVIADDTSLISSRLMDSIVALKLVSFLEEKFSIEFEAHEVDQDNLETIDTIARFVSSKLK
jgi:acyl carrier protein